MASVEECKKSLPSDEQVNGMDDEFFANRNMMDSLICGYLSKRQWFRIKMWVDKVDPKYFLGEFAESDVQEDNDNSIATESPKVKQPAKCTGRSSIPKRIDNQRKLNHCIEDKKQTSMCNKVATYNQSNFKKICITGLYRALKTSDVRNLFEGFGRIISIVHQTAIGRDGRRCAIIAFADGKSADKAIKSMNEKQVLGCKIQVRAAQ